MCVCVYIDILYVVHNCSKLAQCFANTVWTIAIFQSTFFSSDIFRIHFLFLGHDSLTTICIFFMIL